MRKRLAVLMAAFAMMAVGATTAKADWEEDPNPLPVEELCAIGFDIPPGEPGELPVIEDPVTGTADAEGCLPDIFAGGQAATAFAADGNAKATLATVKTDFGFLEDGVNAQVRINAYNTAKEALRDLPSTGTVKYEVTVTYTPALPPNSPPKTATRTVDVYIGTPQGNGSIGGTNTTNFAIGEVPVGATATVKIVSGSVNVLVGGRIPGTQGVSVPNDVDKIEVGSKKR